MANIEPFNTLCSSSTDGLNINEFVKMSANELSGNHNANEPNLLVSLSNDKFFISGDNGTCSDISPQDVASLSSTVGGVILNNVGVTPYIAQEMPHASGNDLNTFSGTEFDFHAVNPSNESHTSFVGSASLFNVPVPSNATNNNQAYLFSDIASQLATPQPEIHAISLDAVIDKIAPLGSSQNPIKIIQQGNQFTPLQNLTQEQLNQLMRVVQKQQTNTSSTSSQEATFYDPNIQQRVVYKICYTDAPVGNTSATNSFPSAISTNATNVDFVVQHKRQQIEAADVLLKMDKEHKKKHRPRTRCGRVSKPPQYMVKDYKHIHPVDYDEDYDDSDGGYSDFKQSSGEEDEANKNAFEGNSLSYASLKSKKFKCAHCEKSYIGKGGLNRHYKLNPTHGKPDEETGTELGDSFYSSDSFQSGVLATCFGNGEASAAQTKRMKAIDDDVTLALEVFPNGESKQKDSEPVYGGSKRGRRGRPPSSTSVDKKRQRLYEVSKHCSDEDILELFIQRCPFTVSLWDILSLKNSKVYDSSVDSLLTEVGNLHDQIGTYLSERLVPLREEDYEGECDLSNKNVFEMVDEKLAVCLNLPVGKYTVKSERDSSEGSNKFPPEKDDYSNRLLLSPANAKLVDLKPQDSQQSIMLPLRKRLKLSDALAASSKEPSPCVSLDGKSVEAYGESSSIRSDVRVRASEKFDQTLPFDKHWRPKEEKSDPIGLLLNQDQFVSFNKNNVALQPSASDDALVSSTSHLNSMYSAGDDGSRRNVVNSSGFVPSVPDSSVLSAMTGSADPALSDVWSDIIKNPEDCQNINRGITIDIVEFPSLDLHNSVSGASVLDGQGHDSESQRQYSANAGAIKEADRTAPQHRTGPFSPTAPDAPQLQPVTVTCYPMQEYIQIQENARYVQTEDGLLIVKNPDGSFQIYGDVVQNITLEMLEGFFAT